MINDKATLDNIAKKLDQIEHGVEIEYFQEWARLMQIACENDDILSVRTAAADIFSYIKNSFSYRGLTDTKEKPLATEISDWITLTNDDFHYSSIDKELLLMTRDDKQNRSQILHRLIKRGHIRKIRGKPGWYRIVKEPEKIEWATADTAPMQLVFPLEEHTLVDIHPGNIIAIAGEKSAGKSTWCLNFAKQNRNCDLKIFYFNSEMGRHELKKRLIKHNDMTMEEWGKITFYARPETFADSLDPNAINIIDFLQLKMDKTYQVGDLIEEIHETMFGGQGIAVVALQKDPGKSLARGGPSSLDKPRLYLTMDKGNRKKNGIIRIFEAKCWKGINPNGMIKEYKIKDGANIFGIGVWHDEY